MLKKTLVLGMALIFYKSLSPANSILEINCKSEAFIPIKFPNRILQYLLFKS